MLEDWKKAYELKNALWIHDKNPLRPHALLTSGKHSSGFFNSVPVTEDATLLDKAAQSLARMLPIFYQSNVSRVVGPAMGAITLAHSVALHLKKLSGYAEKAEVDGEKVMVFNKSKVLPGEYTLIVEDVLTTGGSVELMAQAIVSVGGVALPFVLTLVNRSGQTEIDGRKIIALIDEEMPIWEADDCPLCKAGSKAIRPKDGDNWNLLNKEY